MPICDTRIGFMWDAVQEPNLPRGVVKNYLDFVGISFEVRLRCRTINSALLDNGHVISDREEPLELSQY